MKNFLRKILGIQTFKFILVNPAKVSIESVIEATQDLPILIILTYGVEDVRVIDTGIVVKKK